MNTAFTSVNAVQLNYSIYTRSPPLTPGSFAVPIWGCCVMVNPMRSMALFNGAGRGMDFGDGEDAGQRCWPCHGCSKAASEETALAQNITTSLYGRCQSRHRFAYSCFYSMQKMIGLRNLSMEYDVERCWLTFQSAS